MIQVADMAGAGSPVVRRIVLSDLGHAIPALQSERDTSGDVQAGTGAWFPRGGVFRALRRFPVFTEEEDTASDAGYPVPIGCAFIKLEDSQ